MHIDWGLLFCSSDFNAVLNIPPEVRNPYALADPNLYRGSKDVLAGLTNGTPLDLLFWNQFLLQSEVRDSSSLHNALP